MNLARVELQGARAVQGSDLAGQIVLCAQVLEELPGVVLLDHDHATHAVERRGKARRLRRRQQPQRHQPGPDTVVPRPREGFAQHTGAGSERDHRQVAVAFDVGPASAVVEELELAQALVELREVIGAL